jgi:hypothetical protein
MNRRRVLTGLAGATVIVAGGLAWRAWDNGAFSVGQGPAYEAWHDWRGSAEGPMMLVRAGILAASAHNTQPWRFRVSNEGIALFADPGRNLGSFDPYRREMLLSLGCALENIVQAALAQGMAATVEAASGTLTLGDARTSSDPVAMVRLLPGLRPQLDLYRAIPERHTHRGAYLADRNVSNDLQKEMQGLVPASGKVRLYLFDRREEKAQLGRMIVAATEAIVSDPEMSADSARWFRLDWDAVQRLRDGITLDTAGIPPFLTFLIKLAPPVSSETADRQWLDATRDKHVGTAVLLGLIAVEDLYDRATALEAGRLWQRLHLWLTARGLVAQPLNQPAEMVDRELQLGRAPQTADALAKLTGDGRWRPTFVFRAGYAEQAANLSPRRPLQSVLIQVRNA